MQSRACFVSDHFLYSYYLNMRFRGDMVMKDGKKKILKNYENVQ